MPGMDTPPVRFVPMTAQRFARYLELAVPEYAQAHLKAGDCEPEEALALAQADYDSLLPEGLATAGHRLLSICLDGREEPIGMFWFELREKGVRKSAFIFDFQIDPDWRGKGYGAATLHAFDAMAATLGVQRINLNVMGWNHGAKALYEKQGFHVAGIGMTKVLA